MPKEWPKKLTPTPLLSYPRVCRETKPLYFQIRTRGLFLRRG